MKVIVCLDEKNGMTFFGKRQSRDRKVIEDICNTTKHVWIHPYSESLFLETPISVQIAEDFLKRAGRGEFCFVENQLLRSYVEQIEELTVYQWNRNYPSDMKLDLSLEDWKLVLEEEFAGFSHEKITKQVYVRKEK